MKRKSLCTFISVLILILLLPGCSMISGSGKQMAAAPPQMSKTTTAASASKEAGKTASGKPQDAKQTQTAKSVESPVRAEIPKPPAPAVKPSEDKIPELKPASVQTVVPPVPVLNRQAVGCILPLTGRFAEVGLKSLDALMLSADVYNSRYRSPWKIVVADSGESAAEMQKAVAYLADQARVMAIVAVAGSSEAADAAREAEKQKVPLILITSKEGITQEREYVFQHFLTPSQQMQSLARYALDKMNVAIFSVLYPQDEYGEEMLRHFRREIQKVGGKINRAIPYNKSQTDFTEQIHKLTGSKSDSSSKSRTAPQDARNRMFVDFEALFIPDSPLRVKMISAQLAYYDIKNITLLGTSLWHTPDLLKKNAEYLEGAVFVDSFLPDGFLPETNDFVDVYYSAYSREPDNIEALSYDTMEIVLGLLEDESLKTRKDFLDALADLDRFSGATGSVYFRGQHVSQKSAFILKIQNGKLMQVR